MKLKTLWVMLLAAVYLISPPMAEPVESGYFQTIACDSADNTTDKNSEYEEFCDAAGTVLLIIIILIIIGVIASADEQEETNEN